MPKMTPAEAMAILGPNRAAWELQAMARSLSKLEGLNSPEEAQRLEAAKTLIKYHEIL